MSIKFIDDCEWIQIRDPEWTVDAWGLDHCSIAYQGRRDKKVQFENSLRKFSGLPGYPTLGLESWSVSGGTVNMPIISVGYSGFRSGQVPQARPENSVSVQSAQGSGSYDKINPDASVTTIEVSGTFLYRASRTTWTWFETSKPATDPRHATVQNPLDPLSNIITYSITDPAGNRISVDFRAFTLVFNSLRRQTVVSDYTTTEIIAGKLWSAMSTVDYKLIN